MNSISCRICKIRGDQRCAVSCWVIGRSVVMKRKERGQGRLSVLGDGHPVNNAVVALNCPFLSFSFPSSFSPFFLPLIHWVLHFYSVIHKFWTWGFHQFLGLPTSLFLLWFWRIPNTVFCYCAFHFCFIYVTDEELNPLFN